MHNTAFITGGVLSSEWPVTDDSLCSDSPAIRKWETHWGKFQGTDAVIAVRFELKISNYMAIDAFILDVHHSNSNNKHSICIQKKYICLH